MLRAIREIQPRWVVGENVHGLVNWNGGLVFDEVQADLEAEGYEVQPYVLPAASVNAPHRRDRVWFVAYTDGTKQADNRRANQGKAREVRGQAQGDVPGELRSDGHATNTDSKRQQKRNDAGKPRQPGWSTRSICAPKTAWQNFPTQPPICNGNDGISSDTYIEAISKEHRMDTDIVIKKALDQSRLLVNHDTGKIYSTTLRGRIGEKVELPGANCNGYRVHNIYVDGVKKQCRAHQIVWISANGLYDKKNLMIDHINRDKIDNRLVNLRLVDAKGNAQNVERWSGNFSQNEKDLMHELHENGHMTFREIAEHFGCSKSRVQQIVSEHNGIYGITFPKWRNESIKAGGNAIVPQVALQIFRAIEAYEKLNE